LWFLKVVLKSIITKVVLDMKMVCCCNCCGTLLIWTWHWLVWLL